MTCMERATIETPIGPVFAYATEGLLRAMTFAPGSAEQALRRRFGEVTFVDADDPAGAASALGDYLAGDLGALDRGPVDPGGTAFERSVWSALRAIPAGKTLSYAALARALGRTAGAARAVGHANAKNPIALAIPCHRVIAADGGLAGYAFGADRKRWLLEHERAALQPLPAAML